MAAMQPVTSANSAVDALIEDRRHARSTDSPITAKSPPSPLVPCPPALTEVSKSGRMTAILPTNKVADETAPQIPDASMHSVNAVIDEIMCDSVVIRCLLPDRTLDLRLPPSLIPAELLSFGQPIKISLYTRDGIRTPLIERRNISAQAKFADQQELDTWIESL